MTYFVDDRLKSAEAVRMFGQYLETFESDAAQVRADLFKVDGRVVAYVSFAVGHDATTVSDPWLSCLNARAGQWGAQKVEVIYSGSASLSGNSRLRAGVILLYGSRHARRVRRQPRSRRRRAYHAATYRTT